MRLSYSTYMTQAEFSASADPCGLAILRASKAQDQQARIAEEKKWGEDVAAFLVAAAIRKDKVYNSLGQVVANFVPLLAQPFVNPVHCVFGKDQFDVGCGTANVPRWKGAPGFIKAAAAASQDPLAQLITIDKDLTYQDYKRLCTQCGN